MMMMMIAVKYVPVGYCVNIKQLVIVSHVMMFYL